MATKMTVARLAVAMTAGLCAGASFAADVEMPGNTGYAVDQRGMVARSGTGLCWRTGFWTPAMAIAACDPDLVQKAPAAAAPPRSAAPAAPPAAPAAAAPAKPKKCNFSATFQQDETFAFNTAALTPAAMAKLDRDVIGKLGTCASVDMLLVTGHTDRLGSHAYNQKLSERRAEAVLNYLKGKGANAKDTETMGAGKTQPVKSCDDGLKRAQLIECLAPNRRVVVEVTGPAK